MKRIRYVPFRQLTEQAIIDGLLALWQKNLSATFPVQTKLLERNVIGCVHTDEEQSCLAFSQDQPVGCLITKRCQEPISSVELIEDRIWISLLLVDGSWRRQGIGSTLFNLVETGNRDKTVLIGMDPDHFFPGVPSESDSLGFFQKHGYTFNGQAYDLRGSLKTFELRHPLPPHFNIQRLRATDQEALLRLLQTEFSPRWHYDTLKSLAREKTMQAIVGLFDHDDLIGFAHVYTFKDHFIGPSVYWYELLSDRYGGLGPIGIAKSYRGRGVGRAFLAHTLHLLKTEGVEDMVIDWTVLLDFYGQFGFVPWKTYHHAYKPGGMSN
jgi:GNAT superfamily N-acetyltransferase